MDPNRIDPNYIGSVEWHNLDQLAMWLVFLTLSMIVFAFSMAIAHAIIPSAVSSGHIPTIANKLRPLFYGASAVGAVLVVIVVINIFTSVDAIWDVYPDWWI